jgi:hypothetical protein
MAKRAECEREIVRLRLALYECITEQGAVAFRNPVAMLQRLSAINDLARGALDLRADYAALSKAAP